jgi:hypothetical protein
MVGVPLFFKEWVAVRMENGRILDRETYNEMSKKDFNRYAGSNPSESAQIYPAWYGDEKGCLRNVSRFRRSLCPFRQRFSIDTLGST